MTRLSTELLEANRMKHVWPVVGDAIPFYWRGRIWPLFQEIPGFLELYTEAYIFEQVQTGHWQVWAYSDTEIRGIVATRINIFPRCKILDIIGMAGIAGLEFMEELQDVFDLLATQQRCSYIVTACRPGMERVLSKKFRAQRVSSVLSRTVEPVRRS